MEREKAKQELDDGMSRKYLLTEDVLYILRTWRPTREQTHENLSYQIGLSPSKVKGGFARLEGDKFIHTLDSGTVPPGSQEELDEFKGEIEIFD